MLHAAEINIVQLAHAKMIFNFVSMFLYRARRLSKNVVCLGIKPIFFQFISIMNTLFSISEKQIDLYGFLVSFSMNPLHFFAGLRDLPGYGSGSVFTLKPPPGINLTGS